VRQRVFTILVVESVFEDFETRYRKVGVAVDDFRILQLLQVLGSEMALCLEGKINFKMFFNFPSFVTESWESLSFDFLSLKYSFPRRFSFFVIFF